MLTMSQPATEMLTDVRAQQGIPDDALLRVAGATEGDQGIALGFVDEPLDGDHTASAHGFAYCVAPEVADALSTAKIDVLDPAADATGSAQLVIVPAD